MDGWRTRRHETEVRSAAAGTEVGIALVRSSPWISLTRKPSEHLYLLPGLSLPRKR